MPTAGAGYTFFGLSEKHVQNLLSNMLETKAQTRYTPIGTTKETF